MVAGSHTHLASFYYHPTHHGLSVTNASPFPSQVFTSPHKRNFQGSRKPHVISPIRPDPNRGTCQLTSPLLSPSAGSSQKEMAPYVIKKVGM